MSYYNYTNNGVFRFDQEYGSVKLASPYNPGGMDWTPVANEPHIQWRTVGAEFILYASTSGHWWYCCGDSTTHEIDGIADGMEDAKKKCEHSVLLAVLSCLEFVPS